MAYWLDDGFDTWPEVVRAGKAAVGLYVCCGAWIARNLTDGHVPTEVAAMYGTPEWVAKLVAVGLWSTEEDGYRDVYYLATRDGVTLNPTAEKAQKQKAQKAERQRRWLDKQKQQRETQKTGQRRVSSRSQDETRDGLGDLPPSLPPLKGDGTRGRNRAAPRTHVPHCPYKDRDPNTCSVCASERLVDQELPQQWPEPAPNESAEPPTATPRPTAPTPAATPVDAPSAPANASADSNPTTPRPRRRHPPSAQAPTSPPAPTATHPPPPQTPTPAAGEPVIVHVQQAHGDPVPAELVEDDPNRPNVVKVIYCHSRTGAWIARKRIIQPATIAPEPPPYPPGLEAHHAVWIATHRRGIEAHRPTDTTTGCHRSMRTGHQLQASTARARHQATWCTTCWPTPKETAA